MKMVRIKYALTAEVDVDLDSYQTRDTKDSPLRQMTEEEILQVEKDNHESGDSLGVIMDNIKDEWMSVQIVEVD